MELYEVKIASDHHELKEFMEYLANQGHTVSVSPDDSNYLNGARTNSNPNIQATLNLLWDRYCLSQ